MRQGIAAESIERIIDASAATIFAGAVGVACYALMESSAFGLLGGVAAGLAAWFALQRVPSWPAIHHLPDFAPIAVEFPDEDDELILTDDMTVAAANELLLDDILEELGPDSRVVRLFAKPVLPTAGELSATIDRHLKADPHRFQAPDASDALLNALADLRRSLR